MIVFLCATTTLLILSYLDLRYHKINNWLILTFGSLGIAVSIDYGNLLPTVIGMLLMTILTYILWYLSAIGGADAKLLIALVPYIPFSGIPNMLGMMQYFLVWFAIITLIYIVSWKLVVKNKETIPFIPAITLTYIVTWIFRF